MNILIAEDDLISRKLLTATLENLGHQVDSFTNGEDAWNAHNKFPYRIIVSDWLMPKLDGLDFCRKVRAREDTEYTYFILLSANVHGKETYMKAMQAGIDDFLAKPLDKDQIWMRLRVAERILKYATQIIHLESMLPICSYCKKVRDDNNYWQQVETYIGNKIGTNFSHSVCPNCYKDVVIPQLEELKKSHNEG